MGRWMKPVWVGIVVLGLLACSHKTTKHKKLKPGKPIPCPLKDC